MSQWQSPNTQQAANPARHEWQNAKQYAMWTHIGALAGLVVGFFILVPLIMWMAKRDNPFVDAHGKTAMNFQISMLLYSVAAGVLVGILVLATFGVAVLGLLPLLILFGLGSLALNVILPIVKGMKASNGEPATEYWLAIRFIK